MPGHNRLTIAIAATLLGAFGTRTFAQDSTSASTQFQTAGTVLASSLPDSGFGQKTYFVKTDLLWLGGTALVTGAVMPFDQRIRNWWRSPHVQASSTLSNAVNSLTKINETPLGIASVVTYGIGRLAHSPTTADIGLHWAESMLFTDVFSEAIRGPVGRARPRVSPGDPFKFKFGTGFTNFDNRAFPSLHSAVGFATAAALTEEMRVHHPSAVPYVAPLLYVFALIPGTTRMYLDQHWASDVVSGAFVGQFFGWRTVHYAHTHRRNKVDRALLATSIMPNGFGGTIVSLDVQQLFAQR